MKNFLANLIDKIGIGHRIAGRILAIMLVFSGVFAVISTIFILYADYRRDLNAIESRFDEIGKGYVESISSALWHVNVDLIKIQMQGIARLPDIEGVEVKEDDAVAHLVNPISLKYGIINYNKSFVRIYNLSYTDHKITKKLEY
jgi:hypothetical protein